MPSLRLSIIACPSVQPELEMLAAQAGSKIALRFLEMGLHERSTQALRTALQAAINETKNADAVALGYGLCNRGVIGLQARDLPVIIPRVHDCIGLLLGSRKRYVTELEKEPGSFFQSPGWLKAARDVRQPEFTFNPNANLSRKRLVQRYGKEAAAYLMQQFEAFSRRYRRLAFIATPVPVIDKWERQAIDIATKQEWDYVRLDGDISWLQRLISGTWNDSEFLTVLPGQRVVPSNDEKLIAAEAA